MYIASGRRVNHLAAICGVRAGRLGCAPVRAVYVEAFNPENPVDAVTIGERPDPEPEQGWTVVDVKASSLNHHDVWSARGVGLKEDQLPMIVGTDAAGLDPDGRE